MVDIVGIEELGKSVAGVEVSRYPFVKERPAGLKPEEATAIDGFERMGWKFHWPNDLNRTPKRFDLSFVTGEEDLETARLLLSMVTDYVRAPAIVDSFGTYYARKAYKEKLPLDSLAIVNWNCLRHDLMWAASGGWEMIASLLLGENDPRKSALERMAKKVNEIVKPRTKDESFRNVKAVRGIAFEVLQMFAEK